MCKSFFCGCIFILFFCAATLSAEKTTFFTIKVNGMDMQYKFFDEWFPWQEAKERCAGAGAELLTPVSQDEADEVKETLAWLGYPSQAIWTGITDQGNRGAYRNLAGQLLTALPFSWGDGEPVNTRNGCVVMYGPALYMRECESNNLFVCKVRPHRNGPKTKTYKNFRLQANSNNVLYEYVLHYKHATWYQARDHCASAGAQLWTPEDEAEARAVRVEVDPVYKYSIWTSVNDLEREGVYRTLDSRPISAVHHEWQGGRPISWDGALRCAVLGSDSTLHLALCDSIFPYVCKFTAVRDHRHRAPVVPVPYTM